MMKKIRFLMTMVAMVMVVSCNKSYDDNPDPIDPTAPVIKISGAIVGDTAFVKTGIYIKYTVGNLPLSVESYIFTWNLGNVISTETSPEQAYAVVGLYHVTVTVTPISGGTPIVLDIWVRVGTEAPPDEAIILISAAPSGSNWIYQIGMKVQFITGWSPGDGFTAGDFTGANWPHVPLTQTVVISGETYYTYYLMMPANSQQKQFWGYGKGTQWAYAPNSMYWVVTSTGGVFGAYFNNGQMTVNLGGLTGYPGDGGDVLVGDNPPTVRTAIVYSANTYSPDSLMIYINYGTYANGPSPFISATASWTNYSLTPINGYPGWGYKCFPISTVTDQLVWRFGSNILNPTLYGVMQNSKFYVSSDNWHEIQVIGVDNLKRYEVQVQKAQNTSSLR